MATHWSTEFFANHPVFTHEEYEAARPDRGSRDRRTATKLLAHHVSAGHLVRVRRGLFASVPLGVSVDNYQVDPFLIASKLADDATVAYHAALQFHGKVYSVWHRFTFTTSREIRPLDFQGNEYLAYRSPKALRPKPDLGGGIVVMPHAGGFVRTTNYERTFVDVLDAPELSGGWEEVWRSLEMIEFLDVAAVVEHATRRGSATTIARVGFFLEQHREALFVEDSHLESLRTLAPRQAQYLDRQREPGRLVKAWNLVVPERVLHQTWSEVS